MLHERYRNDDGLHYRPALNPAFRRRALENNHKRAAAAEALRIEQEKQRHRELALAEQTDLAEVAATSERRQPRTEFEKILYRVCTVFGVTVSELKSSRQGPEIAFARHAVCYWACRRTSMSLPQIGRLLGNRDHSTIHHGRNVYPQKRAKMGRALRKLR